MGQTKKSLAAIEFIDNPTKILSIADGKGDAVPDMNDGEFQGNIATVKRLIWGEMK